MSQGKVETKRSMLLIWLCWLVYACSYLGKVNYSANITQIEKFYQVTHAQAGMASTMFFFAYGIGQIFNGFFCKKYNIKWVVFGSLAVCGVCNLLVSVIPSFTLIQYLWLINGAALSVLWPTLIRLLSETLPKEDMARASVVMGTTVATGTLVIYGLSSLFAAFSVFKLSFFVPAVLIPASGVVWLCFFDKFTNAEKTVAEASRPINTMQKSEKMSSEVLTYIVFFAVAAVATNLIKDGLTTWVPSILKEQYALPDYLSILLTLALPLVAVFGNFFAVTLHKKIRDFILLDAALFLGAGGLTVAVFSLLKTDAFVVTLLVFAVINVFVSSSNSVITSIFPLFMKEKLNSGLIAGILNGFCYLGSTISSYGLGAIADKWGWTAVFYVFLGASALIVLAATCYGVGKTVKKK